MISPTTAPLDALLDLEKPLFTAPERPHWSAQAAYLGRVTDEALYGTDPFGGYGSPEAYARDRLDLARGEFRLFLKLWRTMQWVGVEEDRWTMVSKRRALLLGELREVGADPVEWFARMVNAPTTEAFEQEVDRHLSRQVWTTRTFRLPIEVDGLVEEALQRALPYVLNDPEATVGDAGHREHAFRCLELLCMKFLRDTPVMTAPDQEGAV